MSLKGKVVILEVANDSLKKKIREQGGIVVTAKSAIAISNTKQTVSVSAIDGNAFKNKYIGCPEGKVLNPATGRCKKAMGAQDSKLKEKTVANKVPKVQSVKVVQTKSASKHVYTFTCPYLVYSKYGEIPHIKNSASSASAESYHSSVESYHSSVHDPFPMDYVTSIKFHKELAEQVQKLMKNKGIIGKYAIVDIPGVESLFVKVNEKTQKFVLTATFNRELNDKEQKDLHNAVYVALTQDWGEWFTDDFEAYQHKVYIYRQEFNFDNHAIVKV